MNAMTVAEFGRRLGISRASAYRIVASGAIALTDAHATGKTPRVRISDAAFERFLSKREIKGKVA